MRMFLSGRLDSFVYVEWDDGAEGLWVVDVPEPPYCLQLFLWEVACLCDVEVGGESFDSWVRGLFGGDFGSGRCCWEWGGGGRRCGWF